MMSSTKDMNERLREVMELYRQINDLGLSNEHEGILEFRKRANEFVKDALGHSGQIPLDGLKRMLHYKLCTRKIVPSTVVLKYAPHI